MVDVVVDVVVVVDQVVQVAHVLVEEEQIQFRVPLDDLPYSFLQVVEAAWRWMPMEC